MSFDISSQYKTLYSRYNKKDQDTNVDNRYHRSSVSLKDLSHFVSMKGPLFDASDVRLLVVGRATNGWSSLPCETEQEFGDEANRKFNEVGFQWSVNPEDDFYALHNKPDKEEKTYYNMFNPHYYFPFNNETRNNDFYFRIVPMECTMNIYDVNHKYENIRELEIKSEKNKLYEYLTTYGFYGQVNEFDNSAFDGEKCTLIVYNGEISENRPLLAIADFPHKSTSEETYYAFPIVFSYYYGILIEFKI